MVGRDGPLNVKKTKKAKLSSVFVESLIWQKKQKWSNEPAKGEC